MEIATRYISYFFEGPIQIQSFLAVLAVWVGFGALGSLFGGRERIREVDPIIGWAVVSLVMTIGGVFVAVPFTYSALACAALAVFAGRFVWRREGQFLSTEFFKLLLLFGPLLVLVSAMRGSQWDEFSTWLVIPDFLIESDAFPNRGDKFPGQALVAYPFSWHFITYLASRLSGVFLENAGALFNVFLLVGFAMLVIRLILLGAEREELARRVPWSLIALAGLLVSLANPTFAQKVVLTAYADTASAVTTALAAVLGWFMIEALAENDKTRARRLAWQMGGVFLVLVNLKQATLVLLVIVVVAVFLIALRDLRVRILDVVKLLPMILAPPLVIYLTWRYHVNTELAGSEFSILPYEAWTIQFVPKILLAMLTVLAKKGLYLFMIVVIAAIGIRGFLRSQSPFDRFAALTAAIVFGYNAFLLFVYVAVFGDSDPPRVYSYWRYNMHLGMLVVGFIAYAAATLWRARLAGRLSLNRIAWLPVILILAPPLVFSHKIRFDTSPMIRHYRAVGAAVAEQVAGADGIYVVDPGGTGESGVITGYELAGRARLLGYLNAFRRDKAKAVQSTVMNPKVTLIIVHSMVPELEHSFGQTLGPKGSYLLRRSGEQGWTVIGRWPHPPT